MEDAVGSESVRVRAEAQELQRAALALRQQGRLAEAAETLRRAASVAPDFADVLADLGFIYNLLGRPAEAEASYRRALELNPNDLYALSSLAGTLQVADRRDEAETLHRRALDIQPNHSPTLQNLGALLKDAGQVEKAKALFQRALRVAPGLEPLIQAHLALSPATRSLADIAEQRDSYARGLEALAQAPHAFPYSGEKLNLPWYYLAYHGHDDRALLERTVEALAGKVAGLAYAAPHLAGWTAPAGRRIRVGFCSQFLRGHTIGHLFGGFIRHLDRARFEVVVIHGAHSVRDEFRDEIDRMADRALVLDPGLAHAQRQVAELALDALIYPDIAMGAQTWLLAQARLAPVQAVSWGHPNTTGMRALDYFLSAEAIEAPGAEEFYTERLVRMGRLPCCYARPPEPPALPREALKLPAEGALYGCPQTAFKFHPEFDEILAAIVEQDPSGHIVLIEGHVSAHTAVLRERWAQSHPELLERVVFLPRLTHQGFMAHLKHIDVLLDPLHFGSGRTLYEGVATGAPIVTWPGAFARARIVAGAYQQMRIADAPVARSAEEYVALAVGLGCDRVRRAALSRQLLEKSASLFDDQAAVRELEAFLAAAVAAAGRQQCLPAGWRPEIRETAP